MVLNTNDFRIDPPVNTQQGFNPMMMNGGYNPFMSGQFGNYFGYSGGGGVPPASSGFRYRNKKNQLEASVNDANTPEELSAINTELGTLKADRNSYMAAGAASGLPGIVGTIAALHDNAQGLKKLNKVNPETYIPQEVRDSAGAATLAAASAQTADAAQRKSDINANTNMVTGNAQLTASTPEQVQQIALMAQKQANRAINDLGREGVNTQRGNKRYADSLNMNLGNMRQGVKNLIEQQKATLREAQSRNRTQLLENLGQTALTMGV